MYEGIVTVALQYGTISESRDNSPGPAHGTYPTFRGLSVRWTAVSELGRFISSHVRPRTGLGISEGEVS